MSLRIPAEILANHMAIRFTKGWGVRGVQMKGGYYPQAGYPYHVTYLMMQTPNRMTDRRVWKHYLPATTVADSNDMVTCLPWNISVTQATTPVTIPRYVDYMTLNTE